jgi:hypothetical protein
MAISVWMAQEDSQYAHGVGIQNFPMVRGGKGGPRTAVFSEDLDCVVLGLSIDIATEVIEPPWRRVAKQIDSLGGAWWHVRNPIELDSTALDRSTSEVSSSVVTHLK